MARHTDKEPRPRPGAIAPPRWCPTWPLVTNWDAPGEAPRNDFFSTLAARSSSAGGPLDERDLAALLWHSTFLRYRGTDGRFGTWESRSAPASGGLHGTHILCLPLDARHAPGVYDDERHGLRSPHRMARARELNAANVAELAGARFGTTIQFVADPARYRACYDDAETLVWRDAGTMLAIVTLVATGLGLASVPLGRHGDAIVEAAVDSDRFLAVGGVHIGSAHE